MRVLITGANGFIGSNLVPYLAGLNKYKVFAVVREASNLSALERVKAKISIIKVSQSFGSINDAVCRARPDVVVHLAALTAVEHRPEEAEAMIRSNILFPSLLVEAMIRNGFCRLINTGTYWEYAAGSDEYGPFNLYAASKHAFEKMLRYYEDASGLRCLTLKLFGVYGPNDPRGKIFSFFKRSAMNREAVSFSPGRQKLDLVYIDDVVRAYEKAVRYVYKKRDSKHEAVFVGTGKAVALREIAGIFEESAGKPLNIRWGALPYRKREIMESHADIRPAKEKLNWRPAFDLRKGISAMLDAEGRG